MKLTEKRKRRIKYLIFSFMIICITPLCEKGRILNGAAAENSFAGEEIICAIDLGDDMYGKQGLKNGLSHELLKKFAKDNRCDVKIVTAFTGEDYVDSLKAGAVDILITPYSDSIMNQANARQIDQHTVWSSLIVLFLSFIHFYFCIFKIRKSVNCLCYKYHFFIRQCK